MSSWSHFKPYVSVSERRKKAEKAAKKRIKAGGKISPIHISGRTIASTFWGKAWCSHLESFSDYETRLPRGRSYLRNGSVIDLAISVGKVEALVQGSALYKVKINIKDVEKKKWQSIRGSCSGEIDSVVELLQGKLSASVMKTITDTQNGLFPRPKEISMSCSCPDWAQMCKHVAATLYGVGACLDQSPELLFKLRHVDHLELIDNPTLQVPAQKRTAIATAELSNLFGIDIEESPIVVQQASSPKKSVARRSPEQKRLALKKKKTVKKQ